MASLSSALGLRALGGLATTTNHAPAILGFNFFLAFIVINPRHLKQWCGIDHQVSPRRDLAQYGEQAVRSGKITQKQLDMMYRTEAAQANTIENFTLLVGAMALASAAGVEPSLINRAGLIYTGARIAYGLNYVFVETQVLSLTRSLVWWVGNVSCLWLLRKAALKL